MPPTTFIRTLLRRVLDHLNVAPPGGPAEEPAMPLVERLMRPSRQMSDDLEAQLRARQVDAISRLTAPLMLVNLINVGALLLELTISGQLSPAALAWSGVAIMLSTVSLIQNWRRRHRPVPRTASRRAIHRVMRSAAIFGLVWSVPGLLFLPQLTGMSLAFGTALLTGMIAGGAIVLYPIPAAALLFLTPVALTAIAGLAIAHGWLALGPAIIAASFLSIFVGVIRRHGELFTSEFVARHGQEQRNRLIEDLLDDARLEVLGARRLNAERSAGGQKMQAIRQLSGGIAHDFNNILAVVQGHAELARLDPATDRSLLDPIIESCWRGKNQVRRLLAFGQAQSLRPQPVDLPPMLETVVLLAEPSMGAAIELRLDLAADLWRPFVDPAEMEAALISVLMNARDAMVRGGSVVISAQNAPNGIKAARHSGRGLDAVRITIRDTGVGMDEATTTRAVEPFFTTQSFKAGRGLGLSSVDGFVRQSGGTLTLSSTRVAGASVCLLLPREPQRAGQSPGADALAGRQVLVVEDDPVIAGAIDRILTALDCRTVFAQSAEEALRIAADLVEIDMVLTDILLSGRMTGLHLGKELAQRSPMLPVAYMSGLSRAADAPAGAVLAKPFTPGQLADHLRHVLRSIETAEV